jgi:hypothetical protein
MAHLLPYPGRIAITFVIVGTAAGADVEVEHGASAAHGLYGVLIVATTSATYKPESQQGG